MNGALHLTLSLSTELNCYWPFAKLPIGSISYKRRSSTTFSVSFLLRSEVETMRVKYYAPVIPPSEIVCIVQIKDSRYTLTDPPCQALSRRLRECKMLLKSVYSLRILQGVR